jgi:hypothetical protein
MQQATRKSKDGSPPRPGKRAQLKIVLFYVGFADLLRAYDMWSALAAHFKNKIQIVSSAWSFALLRDPQFCRETALKTTDADMFVLSPGGRGEWPEPMRNWIGSWMPRKKGRRDALVAMLNKQTPPTANAARLCDFLRQSAERAGMDFFCNAGEGRERMEASAGL